MFDIANKHFPSAHTRLEADLDIAENAVFESALIKLQMEKASNFTCEAKKSRVPSEACQCFRTKK